VKEVQFPNWPEILARAGLSARQKQSYEITLQWYLNFCRRGRGAVTIQSAREFLDWARQQKQPEPWQVEQWKECLNWFFREGKRREAGCGGSAEDDSSVRMPGEKAAWPSWKVAFLTTVRRRKYSYRTEQSYLAWIERFARHCARGDLECLGVEQIASFLDALALKERLSASSQRQALNALVFLFREVFEKELGKGVTH
jgi:hypothetical protein